MTDVFFAIVGLCLAVVSPIAAAWAGSRRTEKKLGKPDGHVTSVPAELQDLNLYELTAESLVKSTEAIDYGHKIMKLVIHNTKEIKKIKDYVGVED